MVGLINEIIFIFNRDLKIENLLLDEQDNIKLIGKHCLIGLHKERHKVTLSPNDLKSK